MGLALLVSAGACFLVPIALGAGRAFLAADDFQWLQFTPSSWTRAFVLTGRSHFYRPVAELWFSLVPAACGDRIRCLHFLSAALHAANGALLALLAIRLSNRVLVGTLAGVLFATLPGYAEAVFWISAQTMLLGSLFALTALQLVLSADRRESVTLYRAAALVSGLAVFAHEGMASLVVLIPALVYFGGSGSGSLRRLRGLLVPAGCVLAVFVATTMAANRTNYVFVDGIYRPGLHMIPRGLDYLVSALALPRVWWGYLACLVALLLSFKWSGSTGRFAVVLVVAALLPFTLFTWRNVSRYAYVPSMGAAVLLALALTAVGDRWRARMGARGGPVALAAGLALMIGWFTVHARRSTGEQIAWMAAYQVYRDDIMPDVARQTGASTITVRAPQDLRISVPVIPDIVRWSLHDPTVVVHVTTGAR